MPVPIDHDTTAPWWQQPLAALLGSIALFIAGLAKRMLGKRRQEAREAERKWLIEQLQPHIHAAVDIRFTHNVAYEVREAVTHQLSESEVLKHVLRKLEALTLYRDEDREYFNEKLTEIRRMVRSRHQGL